MAAHSPPRLQGGLCQWAARVAETSVTAGYLLLLCLMCSGIYRDAKSRVKSPTRSAEAAPIPEMEKGSEFRDLQLISMNK